MKRVLIFSLTYVPYIGGAEVAIKEITDRIDPSEYAFDMITLRFDRALPKIEKVGNVTVYRLGPSVYNAKVSDRSLPWQLRLAKILFPFTSFVFAWRLDQKYVYDMVWGMMANHAGFGALFFKFFHVRTPYFLELQDGRAFKDMRVRRPILLSLWWLYKRVYLAADVIKAISHFIEREVRGIGYEKTIAVIPNAVDVAKFSAPVDERDIAELKSRLNKQMGDVFLFTASRLVLSRGVEDTIRALSFLPANVKLLIAGSGEDRTALERIAHDIGVAERVIFVGHVDHKELPMYYKISDIFVRPSIIEGFGNSFVEAFAAGIPVIATPVGGIPDFLFDPDKDPSYEPTGLFCEVRNSESIAKAVSRYMQDPQLVTRVVKNAKELVAQKYDWSIIAEDMKKRIFDPLTRRG
ncbi:glycosyltransferase family 4 protein [Candidatus Kaiserbacteria bacterium]|nr:glycosyltransferase family 4 protein [Candidatus Kaiserbacteria bacterium]